jgi:hypothetical protein
MQHFREMKHFSENSLIEKRSHSLLVECIRVSLKIVFLKTTFNSLNHVDPSTGVCERSDCLIVSSTDASVCELSSSPIPLSSSPCMFTSLVVFWFFWQKQNVHEQITYSLPLRKSRITDPAIVYFVIRS